jgi:hypothetical protein
MKMTKFELLSLIATGTYDLLTFLLLIFVVYEAIIKPRRPEIAFYLQNLPEDTKEWGARRQLADFVFENRGPELRNIKITSDPDDIGWDNLSDQGIKPKRTSEYFSKMIPFLGRNERHLFFWCDLEQNIEVLKKPFKINIEFDNPALFFPRRLRRMFEFDFSAIDGIVWGVTGKYDMHNIAQEGARIRGEITGLKKSIAEISDSIRKWRQPLQP